MKTKLFFSLILMIAVYSATCQIRDPKPLKIDMSAGQHLIKSGSNHQRAIACVIAGAGFMLLSTSQNMPEMAQMGGVIMGVGLCFTINGISHLKKAGRKINLLESK